MKLQTAIVKRINDLCKNKGMTINALSYKAGLSQSTVDNIIRGNTKSPTLKTTSLIAGALDLNLIDFLDTDEIRNSEID